DEAIPKRWAWFALGEDRPVLTLAGICATQNGKRGIEETLVEVGTLFLPPRPAGRTPRQGDAVPPDGPRKREACLRRRSKTCLHGPHSTMHEWTNESLRRGLITV